MMTVVLLLVLILYIYLDCFGFRLLFASLFEVLILGWLLFSLVFFSF